MKLFPFSIYLSVCMSVCLFVCVCILVKTGSFVEYDLSRIGKTPFFILGLPKLENDHPDNATSVSFSILYSRTDSNNQQCKIVPSSM